MRGIISKTGFSLIEVNMAILIAAGGLLSLFSLFPGGLRHSVMSQEDIYQSTFASSLLDVVSTNVKKIEDVKQWNDERVFWRYAVGALGDQGVRIDLPATFEDATAANSDTSISDATKQLLKDDKGKLVESDGVWFVYREEDEVDPDPPDKPLLLPTQYFLRLRKVGGVKGGLPARYSVSVVSSHMPAPAVYHRNTVYSMDFYFCGRP
ncbi:MAG: hypothetical protein GX615_09030 [Lentisphaerae bacterium]|nr:hypothetical protein [Lentisphaerota bacterium]